MNAQLPEALVQVAGTHKGSAVQRVEDVGDVRQGVDVARDARVNDAQVVAVAGSRLLTHGHFRHLGHGRGPRAAAGLDDAELQHGGDAVALGL